MAHEESPDPETARVGELLGRAEVGRATAAEAEELALYAKSDEGVREQMAVAAERRELGEGWLERVRKDQRIRRIETGRRPTLERVAGVGMMGVGYLLQFFAPMVGLGLVGLGAFLLVYSLVRTRIRSHKSDPYKDVVQ